MRLSVIIPCFNVAALAPTMIRSLAANVRPDYEFVFVDDASTDRTAQVLDELVPNLPGGRVVRHEANAGLSAARNTGLSHSDGRFVVFLDGDDWVAPGYLPALVGVIERLGCDFVRTDHVRVLGRTRTVVRSPEWRRDRVIGPRTAIGPPFRSTSVDYPNAWAGITDRRLGGLLRFAEQLRTCEDRHWIWRLHRQAESFATVGLLGVFYRQGSTTSLSHITDRRQLHFLDAMELTIAETMADPEADQLLPKAVDAFCALIAFHVNRRGRLSPELQHELLTRSAHALRRLPQDLLAGIVAGGPAPRRRLFDRLGRGAVAVRAAA